jgi:hypothetical protein
MERNVTTHYQQRAEAMRLSKFFKWNVGVLLLSDVLKETERGYD